MIKTVEEYAEEDTNSPYEKLCFYILDASGNTIIHPIFRYEYDQTIQWIYKRNYYHWECLKWDHDEANAIKPIRRVL